MKHERFDVRVVDLAQRRRIALIETPQQRLITRVALCFLALAERPASLRRKRRSHTRPIIRHGAPKRQGASQPERAAAHVHGTWIHISVLADKASQLVDWVKKALTESQTVPRVDASFIDAVDASASFFNGIAALKILEQADPERMKRFLADSSGLDFPRHLCARPH